MNALERLLDRIRDLTLDEPQASVLIVALAKVLAMIDQPTPPTSDHELFQRLCAPDIHATEQRAYKLGYRRGRQRLRNQNAATRQSASITTIHS